MKDDVWSMVHAERAALINDLTHLDDEQWAEPSLCDGWTVHDVVAHLVDTARTTRLRFVAGSSKRSSTDADLSIGDGPEVSGTALSLLLAISGRRVALDELDGPGVATLATAA